MELMDCSPWSYCSCIIQSGSFYLAFSARLDSFVERVVCRFWSWCCVFGCHTNRAYHRFLSRSLSAPRIRGKARRIECVVGQNIVCRERIVVNFAEKSACRCPCLRKGMPQTRQINTAVRPTGKPTPGIWLFGSE